MRENTSPRLYKILRLFAVLCLLCLGCWVILNSIGVGMFGNNRSRDLRQLRAEQISRPLELGWQYSHYEEPEQKKDGIKPPVAFVRYTVTGIIDKPAVDIHDIETVLINQAENLGYEATSMCSSEQVWCGTKKSVDGLKIMLRIGSREKILVSEGLQNKITKKSASSQQGLEQADTSKIMETSLTSENKRNYIGQEGSGGILVELRYY